MRLLLLILLLAEVASARGLKLSRRDWKQTLAAVITAAALVMPLPSAVAEPKGQIPPRPVWRAVFAGSLAEHRSVLRLSNDFFGDAEIGHVVYLGSDRQEGEVFVGIYPKIITHIDASFRQYDADLDYSLFAWDGIVQENARVEYVETFAVPGLEFYSLFVIRIEGLAMADFTPIRLAKFPPPDTPLHLISYLEGMDDPNDWEAELADALADLPLPDEDKPVVVGLDEPSPSELSLHWQRCKAGDFAQGALLGEHSCVSSPPGAAIFAAPTGRLVGFYFNKFRYDARGVLVTKETKALRFPDELIRYTTASFTVSGIDKLPSLWGEIKRGTSRF